jgi:hypothetical protein
MRCGFTRVSIKLASQSYTTDKNYVGDGAIAPVGFRGVSVFSCRRKIFVLYV